MGSIRDPGHGLLLIFHGRPLPSDAQLKEREVIPLAQLSHPDPLRMFFLHVFLFFFLKAIVFSRVTSKTPEKIGRGSRSCLVWSLMVPIDRSRCNILAYVIAYHPRFRVASV